MESFIKISEFDVISIECSKTLKIFMIVIDNRSK